VLPDVPVETPAHDTMQLVDHALPGAALHVVGGDLALGVHLRLVRDFMCGVSAPRVAPGPAERVVGRGRGQPVGQVGHQVGQPGVGGPRSGPS